MSTKDQILSAELHGEALLTTRRPELQPLSDHLREISQGRDDIRTECAGIIAGSWYAGGGRRGEDLIAAGLLMLAGHVDLDELDRWVPVGNDPAAQLSCKPDRPANPTSRARTGPVHIPRGEVGDRRRQTATLVNRPGAGVVSDK
jgi:hypothetical protein